jgi:hypothetical protein
MVQGSELALRSSRLRILNLGFGVEGLEFRANGLGLRV